MTQETFCASAMSRGKFVTENIIATNEGEAKKVFFEKYQDSEPLFFCISRENSDAKIMEAIKFLVA